MKADREKPAADRYIHSIKTTTEGGMLIFTFNVFLLGLVHDALTIQVDSTFKRMAGDLNEWEIVIWYPHVSRGM